jgi:hypothetical protein
MIAIVIALFIFTGCAPKVTKKYAVMSYSINPLENKTTTKQNTTKASDFNMHVLDSEYQFKTKIGSNANSFALVIGVNSYQLNSNVEYADTSALAFAKLAHKTFGIPKENVIMLLNEQATSGQIKAKIELIKELSEKNGNIYLYFAGHGVPGKNGQSYLLPTDMSADAIHLESNLKLDNIYKKLAMSQARNVFVFMDSCFSGKDDQGALLYKGVAPVLRVKKSGLPSSKLTVLTAGQATDFANDYQAKKQRLFSYFLIKELADGKTDLKAVYETIKRKIKRKSLMKGLGYKQVPQMYGYPKMLH